MRNKSIVILAAVATFAVPISALAQTTNIGAVVQFSGECKIFTGDKEERCEPAVTNLRFADGFDAIQFKYTEKGQNLTASFVGSGWKDKTLGGEAAKLPDGVKFMAIREMHTLSSSNSRISTAKPKGQCLLKFTDEMGYDLNSIKTVWCEFEGKTGGKAFGLNNVSRIEFNNAGKDYKKYN